MKDPELLDIQQEYGAYCSGIIGRILSDPRDQEECLNDVWLRVWNALNTQQPTHFKGWLGAIARNCAITRYRQTKRQNTQLEESALELAQLLQNSPVEQIEAQLLGEAISAFLNTQPELTRVVFVRRYWYGDSVEQTARHVGWSPSKVKTVLFRTRGKLKDYLSKEGFYDGT